MQRIQIPTGMGLEEFALSYLEGPRRKGKARRPERAAEGARSDWEARRAARGLRKVEYKEAEPEIPDAPILNPFLPIKEEAAERFAPPLMPPSVIPHQALPPLMPSASEEVFAEPEMPAEPPPEEEIEEREAEEAEYETAEEDVEEMEPGTVMGEEEEDEEGSVEGEEEEEEGPETANVSPAVEGLKWLGELSQDKPSAPSEPLPSLPDLLSEKQPSVLPVILLAAGFIAVGAIIYAIKNPQVISGGAE